MNNLLVVICAIGTLMLLCAAITGIVAIIESSPLEQSCYVIMYTEVMSGDTWQSIAAHWGMTVSALRAMNKGTKLIPGAQIKIAVLAGCPRNP